MNNEESDIQEYMAKGVERLVKEAIKATLKDPKESAFVGRFALASKKAAKVRKKEEGEGLHVPAFLIASITSNCNLHCAGCYSRSNHATLDCKPVKQLTDEEWFGVFQEAEKLGVSFILLAGGEPMLRRDVIEIAGNIPDIVFPVFTNGIFMDEKYLELFEKCRNLIPVMSIEGGKEETDSRRGEGVYDKVISNMEELDSRGLMYGVSITVTKNNIKSFAENDFVDTLSAKGCKAVVFVEFVPVTEEAEELAPDDRDREFLNETIARLRKERPEMIFVSFPGDEKSSGGCLAAGRGFFHINSHGGAEPCPFSPYSDINVKDTSLKEAISSRLFETLKDGHMLEDDHVGGCVLVNKKEQLEQILSLQRS